MIFKRAYNLFKQKKYSNVKFKTVKIGGYPPKIDMENLATITLQLTLVRDEPKLADDSGELPKPNQLVDDSIPDHEIVSLLDQPDGQETPLV